MQEIRNNVLHNQSDVARLREQLDAECEAARRAMHGYAEVAKHAIITAKMEKVGMLHEELRERIGEEADVLLVQAMEA